MSNSTEPSERDFSPINLNQKMDIVIERYDSLHLSHKKPFTNFRLENGSLIVYDKYRYRPVEPNKNSKSDYGKVQLTKHPKLASISKLKKSILIGVSENGNCIACITSSQTVYVFNKELDSCQELKIDSNFIEIIDFPDDSKFMIRTRSAGTGLYDQINNLNQTLFISNDGNYVIFVSMKGIAYIDVLNNEWKMVNKFHGKFTFQYDVSFSVKDDVIESIKIVLAMKMRSSQFTEKLEFQNISILLKDGDPVVRLANLMHQTKIPLEIINSYDCQNTNPLMLKIIKDKCVVVLNYCDNHLEFSKLFLLYKPENEVILCVPILPDMVDKITSTSRSVYIQCIQPIPIHVYEEANKSQESSQKSVLNNIDQYSRPLVTSEMFMLVLSNGEFLIYSEFDGRLIEIKSKELYSQNKFQNLKLYNENIETSKTMSTKNRKRDGAFHSFVTKDNFIVISNGFDFIFYRYEFTIEPQRPNQLIQESNMAYLKEIETINEFPRYKTYIDKYDKLISYKFYLKDDLFLNPARLLPRCAHLISYAILNHAPPQIKRLILQLCVQSTQFFTYANELVLAETLLEKLESVEYSIFRIPNSPFYFSSLKNRDKLIDSLIHRTTNKEVLVYDSYSSIDLRLSLIMKCFAAKAMMAEKKSYHPSLLIYSLIDEDRLKIMKERFLKYKEIDKSLDNLYTQAEVERPRSKELSKAFIQLSLNLQDQNKLSRRENDKPEQKIISSIQIGNIDEAVTELSDFNLDFTDPIENQMEDLKHYSYFLLSIFRMFGSISYFEMVSFVAKIKQAYKSKSK